LPLYEYECPKHGRFDRIQKFSDPPLTSCPQCGAPVEKLLSAPAIQFKGTGWYVTDYARKSGGPEPGKTTSSQDGGKDSKDASSATKSDSSATSTAKKDK